MRAPILLVVLLLAGCAEPPAEDAPTPPTGGDAGGGGTPRAVGDAVTFARAPGNWHIEGIAIHGERVVSGTAFGAAGDPVPLVNLGEPSRVFVWDRDTGDLLDTILVEGEDTTRPHGLVGLAFDARGRLYGLSSQLGLLRWTETSEGWSTERLATFPDLKPCALAPAPCSPTLRDEPPIGNDLTWGPDGALYVSDSFQATIWRIGDSGEPEPWFQSEALDRKFGANGLRITPDGTRLVVAVTGPDSVEAGPLRRPSVVLAVPYPDPEAGEVETVFTLPNGDLADGIAFGEDGDLYVASNAGDRLFIVPAGGGAPRIIANADLPPDAQMDFPASLAFDGQGVLLVANYAFMDGLANPAGRSVLDLFVDDRGHPVPGPTRFRDG